MEKKMTYAVALDNAIAVVENEEVKARLLDLKKSLQKKASSKKATKTQIENEGIKDVICEVLASAPVPMTVTSMQKANVSLGELSNQKVTSLLRQLRDSGKVDKKADKKTTVYFLVD